MDYIKNEHQKRKPASRIVMQNNIKREHDGTYKTNVDFLYMKHFWPVPKKHKLIFTSSCDSQWMNAKNVFTNKSKILVLHMRNIVQQFYINYWLLRERKILTVLPRISIVKYYYKNNKTVHIYCLHQLT